jgi:hypothetical protein
LQLVRVVSKQLRTSLVLGKYTQSKVQKTVIPELGESQPIFLFWQSLMRMKTGILFC